MPGEERRARDLESERGSPRPQYFTFQREGHSLFTIKDRMKNEEALAFTIPLIVSPYLAQALLMCPQILLLCVHARSKFRSQGRQRYLLKEFKNFKVHIYF